MLTGGQFYDVLCAVVPLYVALFLGYGSLKWWGVVTPEQSAGISRFNALIAMPPLIFEIIAFNNPYTMNNRLIAAYCLSNGIVLVGLCAWVWCTKCGNLDWVITLFQLSVMPNTIIVGIPVLSPLYSVTESGIAAIFIGQVLWLFPTLFLYELKEVRKMGQPAVGSVAQVQDDGPRSLHSGETTESAAEHGFEGHESGIPALLTQGEHNDFRIGIGDEPSHAATEVSHKDEEHVKNGSRQRNSFSVANGESGTRENGTEHGHEMAPSQMNLKEMAIKVAKKMVQLPLTHATVMGIVYSLIAGRWGFDPLRILRNSLDIMGRITLGLTMYSIGLFMAGQKKLVASWWVAFYGAFCRFIVGPGTMGVASLLLGLRGDTLRFAFLQAALPQAVISFVFAKDYNLHTDVFTTAVSLQTIVFMPIVLVYYTLLEL
ncbi:probable auxin efflux carrier component 9 [Physcomitrium patens]|uniref:Auxin efflux carrier component n=1 Tax=Physcomitrium patens TaxID=3218 RepID=A0A2K1JGY3_PHYPA|nr:probable auxin efflux carrier component 1b [Physcomitrium patens]PNR40820.1 hypothetical protein PHYPA_018223 [Physcomitrium patens]|eukprot:XP_024394044.1 probable auxin efflux carrier component 1b [Physcomitrella patens]